MLKNKMSEFSLPVAFTKVENDLDTMARAKKCRFENEQKLRNARNIEDLINIKISRVEDKEEEKQQKWDRLI